MHPRTTKARLGAAVVAAALATVTLTLALAAPAGATTGGFNQVQATCFLGRKIVVTAPTMSPPDVAVFDANGGFIIDPPWRVAFMTHVDKWNFATRTWVRVASGPWKSTTVTHASHNISDTWLNHRTNLWEAGTTTFSVFSAGYYRVTAEYYWYPQYGDPGGRLGPYWTPFHSYNGYMGWGDPWCYFA